MLSDEWIDALFARMTGIYGNRFTRLWENINISLVRKTWATELACFADHPERIRYALEHLPEDQPPTALAFRRIGLQCPDKPLRIGYEGRANPEELARAQQAGKTVLGDSKAWARRILARAEAGETILPISLRFAKEALRTKVPMEAT
jgi:hypothetical protein